MWHTQTSKKAAPTIRIESELDSSLKYLLQEITALGMGHISSSSGKYCIQDYNYKKLPYLLDHNMQFFPCWKIVYKLPQQLVV